MAGPHGCTGTTRKGAPCGGWPLKGRDICLAHADQELRESVGFGGRQPGAGRPRVPGPTELARRVIEDNVCIVYEPHFRALGYTLSFEKGEARLTKLEGGGAKVHSSFQGQVFVSEHDDLGAMIDVAEKLVDRVYGKPKQSTELSGPEGGPVKVEGVDVSNLTDTELAQLRELLSRAGPVA